MLVRYKKAHEKIAMGLLSYMPGDKSVKKLSETISLYETEKDHQLYLLKKDEDFIGIVGIHLKEDAYIVLHLAINPSFRGEGIGSAMIAELSELFPDLQCRSTVHTEAFMQKCREKEESE